MAGADLDQANDYAFDVFTQFTGMSAITQADFKAIVPFAAFVANATAAQLEEVVLRHGAFSPTIGEEIGPLAVSDYAPWTDMMKRWAQGFLALLDRRATDEVKNALGRAPMTARVALR